MPSKRWPLDEVVDQHGEPYWRLWDRRILFFMLLLLLWTFVAHLDRVITAQGKVVPYDKVKVIQHLEGGIIKTVLVRENQEVKMGEPLVELDLAMGGVNGAELNARMASFRLAQIRLQAEAMGTDARWPTDLDRAYQAVADAERSTFQARRAEHMNTLSAIDGQITQGRQRVAELRARLSSLEASLRIAQQELAISEGLVKDKLVSQLEHFQRRSAVERLSGDIESTRQAIPGAQAGMDEALARRREEESKFRRRATDERTELERKMASLSEDLSRAQDQEGRAIIRAPIDGVVKNVKYQSIGNVVKSGEPIMEVVPLKDQMVVELKLSPADRGLVMLNQAALVKISAYDFYRYGGLDGHVTAIGADTDSGRNEEQFYRVVVSTNKSHLGGSAGVMPITPGMTAEVDIKVDTQSVFWSLLRPVMKLKHEAFREI
ncbi:MAG: HlyD family type I secretion periplasmic adaptor subunit [Pseudomonadota bacterium]